MTRGPASALILRALLACIVLLVTATAHAAPRPIYAISDLHLGIGRTGGASSDWHPLEDFRWPLALRGLLQQIIAERPEGADLVIAGDFLELWQHPGQECFLQKQPACGCTVEQMEQVVKAVVAAHRDVFEAFGEFLASGRNRIVVTPGNHDAALLVDSLWSLVRSEVPQESRDRFIRADSGTWFSESGAVAIEHGHQQTFDVNYFPDWDAQVDRVTTQCPDGPRLFRPWGENLVQSLYNRVENAFPGIDNMVPESAGIAAYWQLSGGLDQRADDVARFLAFNLLQTSFFQKASLLKLDDKKTSLTDKEVERCRRCLGGDLLMSADLPAAQALRQELAKAGAGDGRAQELRRSFDGLIANTDAIDAAAARNLCERAVVNNGGTLPLGSRRSDDEQCQGTLSMLAQKAVAAIFDASGTAVLSKRVSTIQVAHPALQVYIYGHTHEARVRQRVRIEDGSYVDAFNTGAFQRLIDPSHFEQLRREGESTVDLWRRFRPESAQACYSVVAVDHRAGFPRVQLKQWFMEESPAAGQWLDDCSPRCSAPPANCPAIGR